MRPRALHLRLVPAALALAIVSVHIAEAQQASSHRIGFVSVASQSSMSSRVQAFRQSLRELGYIEGHNITIEYRWAEGREERLTGLVSELLSLNVGLLVTHGVLATVAARNASVTIPILCSSCDDLVSTGLVNSLARPGGNITGLTLMSPEMSGKRLELLKEILPGLTRVVVLFKTGNPVSAPELEATQAAARLLNLQLQSFGVEDPSELESVFSSMRQERAGAILVLSDAMFSSRRQQIADLAAANRLPSVSWSGDFAKAGGLLGYGPDVSAVARRAASYVDRILKGARPADLPVERPTKFELVINLKTAKALGIAIPADLLSRADEVIE